MEQEKIQLTRFSHGGGCGCKISPAVLSEIIGQSKSSLSFADLLVGNDTRDDAAVYALNDETCVISTTDFFMPIVNDAFDFGKVAAANSISDIYAMGGTPLMAIAILGWPVNKIPATEAGRVLEGGRAVCDEAGIPLAGGHSIDSPEPFFGLAVTGTVQKENLKQNNGAQIGDDIYLTKPLGVGIVSSANKKGLVAGEELDELIYWLTRLNSLGEKLGKLTGVNAMTDVTGFGLLGHLHEVCESSGVAAEIDYSALPVLDTARKYLAQNISPDASSRNWSTYSAAVEFARREDRPEVNMMEAFRLLPDPQTNGGLLICASPMIQKDIHDLLVQDGLEQFIQPIGRMVEAGEKRIIVY